MKRKILLILLCAFMFFSTITPQRVFAQQENNKVYVTYEDKTIGKISIEKDEKKTLVAGITGDAISYQWQVLIDSKNSVWVDISGQQDKECEISFSMFKSILNNKDVAYIRCRITTNEGQFYSDKIKVSVKEASKDYSTYDSGIATMSLRDDVSESATTYNVDEQNLEGLDLNYVTITIKYLDASSLTGEEKSVYSPYMATIEKGSDFTQDVVSPTLLGYAPYFDSDNDGLIDDDGTVISLDFTGLQNNVEINIYYTPIDVDFAIRYFFQNINDDLYTEDVGRYHTSKAQTGSMVSDEYLRAQAGNTTGFEKLYHYPETIAADGSTIFECYYDRNYYLIKLDLDGGYGVEPIYARYGSPFIIGSPINPGHIFKGWDLLTEDTNNDGVPDKGDGVAETTLPSIIPADNRYFKALWETIETTSTVVYWLENPDVPGTYDYWGSYEIDAHSGDVVNGMDYKDYSSLASGFDYYEKKYSYLNEEKTNVDTVISGDGSTSVNVYYDRKEYDLRFYYAASKNGKYYIVGGSTYFFGQEAGPANNNNNYNNGDEIDLLDYAYLKSAWGEIIGSPQLNENGKKRNYTFGETASGDTAGLTYHYISFKAKYGANMSELWPCNVFEHAERANSNSSSSWNSKIAYVSAWNGEHHTNYSQKESNETVKGVYEKLDYRLLFDSQFEDSSVVAFLCYWLNGADVHWSVPNLWVYNVWVPILAGEDTSGYTTTTYNGITYKLLASYDTADNSDSINDQTYVSLEGYTFVSRRQTTISSVPAGYRRAYNADFFYSRNMDTLKFYNYNTYVENTGGEINFGTPMEQFYFVPEYPTNLEEDAYTFAGWYTTSGCYPGSEFGNFQYDENGHYVSSNFDGFTTPGNLTLYAKWAPKLYRVNFFKTYEDLLLYEEEMLKNGSSDVEMWETFEFVEHGKVVGNVEEPERENNEDIEYDFNGWFYVLNGEKKIFSTLDIPVKRNLNIFADWTSMHPQPYKIQYVLKDNPSVKVADDTTGFAYTGSTRTFTAKAGEPFNQLYDEYNQRYFPTVGSHSITMQAEEDKNNPRTNIHTFYYVSATNIEYLVKYVNKETNTVMSEERIVTNNAVVTEQFKQFDDMIPDAFYKRLVLSVEYDPNTGTYVGSGTNVITFYYTPDKKSAYYTVHHMFEKLNATTAEKNNYAIDGSGGYEEIEIPAEGIGDIGSKVSITPQTFAGFNILGNKAVILMNGSQTTTRLNNGQYSITISESGTELYIFYQRAQFNYTVHYYHYNTITPVSNQYPSKTGSAIYGTSHTETAPNIPGYTCVSALTTQTITMRDKEEQNVIIFYYSPIQYVAEYVAVPDAGGWLSNTIEVVTGDGLLAGSTPVSNNYYEFVGWYLDEACTQSAASYGTIDSITNQFIPHKDMLSETSRNIFYAKFNQRAGNITIDRNNVGNNTQVFVYKIKNNTTGEEIMASVKGTGNFTIHGLPFGDYTITQENKWSWRYNDAPIEVSHSNASGTTVVFRDLLNKPYWLTGNSSIIKERRG